MIPFEVSLPRDFQFNGCERNSESSETDPVGSRKLLEFPRSCLNPKVGNFPVPPEHRFDR